ncbi:MAG: type I-C CRISPR-associated protein Cas8c/Csd1 [Elusimicrobiales bacterium]
MKEYYDRKAINPESHMAPDGFEWKEIPYIIILDKKGEPINIESTWEGEGKAKRAKSFLVPQAVKKSVNIAANYFWDNPEYALGVNLKQRTPARILEMHKKFVKRIEDLKEIADEGLQALKLFNALPDKAIVLKDVAAKNPSMDAALADLMETGRNLSFRLAGDTRLIVEREAVHNAIKTAPTDSMDANNRICLVTGQKAKPSRLHPPIKGVWGAQTMGANIVSFNLDAFNSYGKKQGTNAPIGEPAVFAYTTALNYLLGKDSKQRIQVGGATTVFWAEKASSLEKDFADFFNLPPKEDPDRGARAVESFLCSVENGTFHSDEGKARFYILGLAPNASRLAVRFWINNTVGGVSEKIARHFKDMELVHGPKESGILPIFRLLVSTAAAGKAENIPPNLAGETMRAIFEGLPYPRTLLQAAIRRIRAEHDITPPRAALIKASINRFVRYQNQDDKEDLKVSLGACPT